MSTDQAGREALTFLSRSRGDFQSRDEVFQMEQSEELLLLDFFCERRDALLREIGNAQNFDQLLAASNGVDAFITKAEQYQHSFQYLSDRMEAAIQSAVHRIQDKLELVQNRLNAKQHNTMAQAAQDYQRAEADREYREHVKSIDDSIKASRVRMRARRKKRTDIQHRRALAALNPGYHCHCGANKLIGHRCCHSCYHPTRRNRGCR